VTGVDKEIASGRIDGSFRDPSGYVFRREERIYRAIDEDCCQTLRGLSANGLLRRLMDRKLVVGTSFVEDPELVDELAAEHPGYRHFLEHQRVEPITYPYEWCLSMLADAALLTLELQMQLLGAGLSLKDATAYNVQFVGSQPTFIDLSSVERHPRQDVWFALGQFSQMFTFPLLLFRYHGWDFRSYFLGNIGGRDIEQVNRSFGRFERWLPRALLDVTLPLILHRKAKKSTDKGRAVLDRPNSNSRPQMLNLQRLQGKIRKLAARYKPRGIWARYTSECSYDDAADQAKKALVREFLQTARPTRVLDMGCNVGDYSYLAAQSGAVVLAADADHDAVEILYRRLRDKPAPITPMVVDLTNPSPAIGYRNKERESFLERLDVDCVLALALLHHLHVTGNLGMGAICDQFWEMTNAYLILEFVPPEDPMFRELMKFRVDLYRQLTLESCRKTFESRFTVLREEPIPGSPRTLLFLRKLA
jgi:SAM-dependent methyltransferase